MLRPQTRFGTLILGRGPKVVGTVAQSATLAKLATGLERQCDIIELRLDLLGTQDGGWLKHALAIEAQGVPVIATVRLASEGDNGRDRMPSAGQFLRRRSRI